MQSEFESAAQEVGAKAKAGAGPVRDEARRTAEDLREQFADTAESAKEQLGGLADSLKQTTREMADEQKVTGAEQLSGLARAINHAADELQNDLPQAASYVRQAAAKVDEVSTMIRERSIEDLAHETNDFARANKVAFFGMSLAAGFALARFLKSGAPSSQPTSGGSHAPSRPHPISQSASAPPEHLSAASSSQF